MEILKLKECSGYNKEEAFANLKFNPDHPLIKGTNCTQAWNQYGKPIPGTAAFKKFAIEQLEEKTHLQPGFGLYVTIESPIPDIRKRPYSLITNKVYTTRQWSNIVYLVVEADLSVNNLPSRSVDVDGSEYDADDYVDITVLRKKEIIGTYESLAEAKQEMKKLTTETHKQYIAMAIKVPDIHPIVAYSIYTPSSGAKPGRFLAFGIDADV